MWRLLGKNEVCEVEDKWVYLSVAEKVGPWASLETIPGVGSFVGYQDILPDNLDRYGGRADAGLHHYITRRSSPDTRLQQLKLSSILRQETKHRLQVSFRHSFNGLIPFPSTYDWLFGLSVAEASTKLGLGDNRPYFWLRNTAVGNDPTQDL